VTARRITSLEDPAFGALFTGIERSWFRLETLQRYDVGYEREEYEAFVRGGPVDLAPGPWQEMTRAHVAAGRTLARVHVLTEPLTVYARYELATAYQRNSAAGEDIRIIAVPEGAPWPRGVPHLDYWLFDEQDVWLMAYDADGRFLFTEQHNEDLSKAITYRDAAMSQSAPLAGYAPANRRAA